MTAVKGTVLHCGKYGCIVRLHDGRLANLPAAAAAQAGVRRVLTSGRRPEFEFIVTETEGWPMLSLARAGESADESDEELDSNVVLERSSSSTDSAHRDAPSTQLDEKIIEYLRQTADWDPNGAIASRAQEAKETRADRLLPFEARARRQYRDTPRKPPRKKR